MSYDHWKTTEPHQVATHDRDSHEREPEPRCELCWCPAYGSFPGHVLCREHFMAHQQQVIAAMAQRVAVTVSLWVPVAMAWSWGLWRN
jgi:hypothetical protein